MGASVTLVTPAIAVEPGQSVSITLKVRNTGSVVDEFALDVLGDAAAWAAVEPPTINLFPGAEGEAKAVFRPPRAASTPAGLVPFGLRARSREDPAGSAVEEGIRPGRRVLGPVRGARAADVAWLGLGLATTSPSTTAATPACRPRSRRPTRTSSSGSTSSRRPSWWTRAWPASRRCKVSPAKRFWRGQPKTRPFQLFIRPEGGLPITLDGTLLQESILPPWFLKALLLRCSP